jgi:uncharacterized protein involved in exopolysaccharide biosynthesis
MSDKELVVAAPSMPLADRVASLVVVINKDITVSVPLTAADNLLMSQVRVAQLREVIDKQIELLKGTTKQMKPMDIKSIVDSFTKIEEMGRFAYAPALNEAEGGERAGRAAAQLVQAMAEGMTTAAIKSNAKDREKRILELGSVKPAPVVRIVDAD